MKKALAILLAVLLLVGLCACGADTPDITFKNDLKSVLHGVHISPESAEEWGDALNYAKLSVGSSIHIDFEKFAGESGVVYDIGLIDENSVNYDIYGVELAIDDELTISGDSESATLIVKSADGSTKSYDVLIY